MAAMVCFYGRRQRVQRSEHVSHKEVLGHEMKKECLENVTLKGHIDEKTEKSI